MTALILNFEMSQGTVSGTPFLPKEIQEPRCSSDPTLPEHCFELHGLSTSRRIQGSAAICLTQHEKGVN